jgi:hypothetical protein
MLNEEIYVLTKHGGFNSEYVENLPIYRRRHFLYLLDKEAEIVQNKMDSMKNSSQQKFR